MLKIEDISADVVASFLGKGSVNEEKMPDGRWVYMRPQLLPLVERVKDAIAVLKGDAFALGWPKK